MRKSETGGVLLVVVALVALATFAYIGFVLTRDPQKAEIVAEGVEEATEGADDKVMAEGQAITDAFIAAGYPDAANLSEELKTSIVAAFDGGSLNEISRTVNSEGEYAVVVGTTALDSCGEFGQDLCFLIVHDEAGTRPVYVVDSFYDSPNYDNENVTLLQLSNGQLSIVRAFGDAGATAEIGYVIDTTTLAVIEGVTHFTDSQSSTNKITRGEAELQFTVVLKGTETVDGIEIATYEVSVSDAAGAALTREEPIIELDKIDLVSVNHVISLTEPEDNIAFSILGYPYLYDSTAGKFIESSAP